MTLAKLKTKNQITIPNEVVKYMKLSKNEIFSVEVEKNYIKLTPVAMAPRYTPKELAAIDKIVDRDKSRGKRFGAGQEFGDYIKKIA